MIFPTINHDEHAFEKRVLLTTTRACNLSCAYCYEHFKDNRTMPFETARQCVSREIELLDYGPMKTLSVEFFGGEPFLNFQLIQDVVDWVRDQPFAHLIRFSVQTNGTVLSTEIRNWLSSHSDVVSVGLSYDGVGMNAKNRGTLPVDVDFFAARWPQHPVSTLLIPETVDGLFDTVKDFVCRKIPFELNLADGYRWGDVDVKRLDKQLDLCESYIDNYETAVRCGIIPYDPFDFYLKSCREDHQFCEDKHSCVLYDVDGRDYFCHLFSPATLGEERAVACRKCYEGIKSVMADAECSECPLRTFCQPCFGWRNLIGGSISATTEKDYLCCLRKCWALRCARSFCNQTLQFLKQGGVLDDMDAMRARNAVRYIEGFLHANV